MTLRFRAAIAFALLLLSMPAFGQGTAKPKSSLNAEISSQFPDNAAGAITPQVLRNVTNDMVASSQQYAGVNAQVGTTYTVQTSDYGQFVTFNNGSAIAVTLPAASTTGFTPFSFYAGVLGAGTVTITPAAGTINGAANLALTLNQGVLIVSDGTNWQVVRGFGVGTLNSVALTMPSCFAVAGSPVTGSTGTFIVTMNGTQGGIPWFSSATNCGSSAALTQFGLMVGGGASGAPSAIAAGTNGQVPLGQTGANPAMTTLSGDVTSVSAAGVWVNGKVNGVTQPSSGTSGGIKYFNTTSSELSSALLTANAFMLGGGAGNPPTTLAITGLVLGNGASAPTAYGGTTCTNQFVRAMSAAGAATCNTVSLTADVTGTLPVTNGGLGIATGTSGGVLCFTAATTIASSVAATANAIMLGGGAGACPTPMASLGTTTTVLHGNAAGAPTFGAVSLTADITGTLGLTNGGTNNSLTASNGGIIWSDASKLQVLAGTVTAGQCLLSGSSATPSWGSCAGGASVTSIAGNTGAFTLANGIDNSTNQIQLTAARRTLPTVCAGFSGGTCPTSGTGATYTTPANVLWLEVKYCGGGGGGSGAASGTTAVAGSNGSASIFNSVNANGGTGGSASAAANAPSSGGAGGVGGSGTATFPRMPGPPGMNGSNNSTVAFPSGGGGSSVLFGGGGAGIQPSVTVGNAGATNSGGGGGGASNNSGANNVGGAGGGAGECVALEINSPAASYLYTIGPGGAGGVSTTNGGAGGAGGMYTIEHYGT